MADKVSKEQKSAAVVSVWHCIISVHFMKAEKEHLIDANFRQKTATIYKRSGDIRTAITSHNDRSRDLVVSMAEEINAIVTKIPEEKWNHAVDQMMQELVSMRDLVKEKGKFNRSLRSFSTVKTRQGRQLSCLLTLWYWLGAWSNLHGPAEYAKTMFLNAVEENEGHELLADQLLNDSVPSDLDQRKLHDLLMKLQLMLSTHSEHWVDVLEQFTKKMAEAAKRINQMDGKKLDGVMATNHNIANVTYRSTVRPTTMLIAPVAVIAGEILGDILVDVAVEEAVDVIDEVIVDVWVKKKPLDEAIKDAVVSEGEKIVSGAEKVGEVVLHGVEEVGKAVIHVVHEVEDLALKIGQGVKNLFHLF